MGAYGCGSSVEQLQRRLCVQDTASPDIDIALDDNVMGAQFAAAVSEYLTSVGEEARGIGVIKSNPEQSKHLETATMRVGAMLARVLMLRLLPIEHSQGGSMQREQDQVHCKASSLVMKHEPSSAVSCSSCMCCRAYTKQNQLCCCVGCTAYSTPIKRWTACGCANAMLAAGTRHRRRLREPADGDVRRRQPHTGGHDRHATAGVRKPPVAHVPLQWLLTNYETKPSKSEASHRCHWILGSRVRRAASKG